MVNHFLNEIRSQFYRFNNLNIFKDKISVIANDIPIFMLFVTEIIKYSFITRTGNKNSISITLFANKNRHLVFANTFFCGCLAIETNEDIICLTLKMKSPHETIG